ncbi:hypothetical protein GCM10010174_15630 [Kutzneria viridogrisea]|uniref:Uncharacterized protein n=1 Tax=Kutzneria viridogrisea TaxID=47990 RepID=A0ABR6BGS4_9PSEU|nr:hypothetical protein [Kutzneria albida]MBA8926089.1 hypothetical protein [Kutzneria viridogrisea]
MNAVPFGDLTPVPGGADYQARADQHYTTTCSGQHRNQWLAVLAASLLTQRTFVPPTGLR